MDTMEFKDQRGRLVINAKLCDYVSELPMHTGAFEDQTSKIPVTKEYDHHHWQSYPPRKPYGENGKEQEGREASNHGHGIGSIIGAEIVSTNLFLECLFGSGGFVFIGPNVAPQEIIAWRNIYGVAISGDSHSRSTVFFHSGNDKMTGGDGHKILTIERSSSLEGIQRDLSIDIDVYQATAVGSSMDKKEVALRCIVLKSVHDVLLLSGR